MPTRASQASSARSTRLVVFLAIKALADARTELGSNKKKLVGWQKMVDVFDHEGIIDQATEDIATMEATVLDMAKLWQIRKDVDAEQAASYLLEWDGLDPEDLEDASKKMIKLLMSDNITFS